MLSSNQQLSTRKTGDRSCPLRFRSASLSLARGQLDSTVSVEEVRLIIGASTSANKKFILKEVAVARRRYSRDIRRHHCHFCIEGHRQNDGSIWITLIRIDLISAQPQKTRKVVEHIFDGGVGLPSKKPLSPQGMIRRIKVLVQTTPLRNDWLRSMA